MNMAFLINMLDVFLRDEASSESDSDLSDGSGRLIEDEIQLRRRPLGQAHYDSNEDSYSDYDMVVPGNVDFEEYFLNPKYDLHNASGSKATDRGKADNVKPLPSLLQLSVSAVGKHCSCQMLENSNPPLDETLLRKVAFSAFPTDIKKVRAYASLTDHIRAWSRGESLVLLGKVREMWQVGFMATAYIEKYSKDVSSSSNDIRVSLTFEQQRILWSTCSDCKTDIWCLHVVAAVVYRIRFPEKVPVYAPMTETLCTLNREQLQKVLQYAVHEDPAGILGKVFKHIDAVRSAGSQMNTMEGIPDPTFGGMELENSHWKMSVDILEKSLQKNLAAFMPTSSLLNMEMYYPDSYLYVKKRKTYLAWYTMRVTELIRNGEYSAAADVLICIMANILKFVTPGCQRLGDITSHAGLRRYFHDMCRFYALVMIYIRNKDISMWNRLNEEAEKMRKMPILRQNIIKQSTWAELPTISLSLAVKNPPDVMCETKALSDIEKYSPNYMRYMDCGDEASLDCDNTMHINLFLARLETLKKFEKDKLGNFAKVTRLALHILDLLAHESKKHSIMGDYLTQTLGHCDFKSLVNEDLASVSETSNKGGLNPDEKPWTSSTNRPHSPDNGQLPTTMSARGTYSSNKGKTASSVDQSTEPSTSKSDTTVVHLRDQTSAGLFSPIKTRSKRRASMAPNQEKLSKIPRTTKGNGTRKKSDGSKRVLKSKKNKDVKNDIKSPEYTKGQLAYALLYCCNSIIEAEARARCSLCHRELLLGYTILALEMSRFRTAAPEKQVSDQEHACLHKFEQAVSTYMQRHLTAHGSALHLYMESLVEIGYEFYEGVFPLMLIDSLAFKIATNVEMKQKWSSELVEVVAHILSNMPTSLSLYTMPSAPEYTFFFGERNDTRNADKDYIAFKIHTITSTFLSMIRPDNDRLEELVIQVLESFKNLQSVSVLNHLLKDLKLHLCNLQHSPKVLEVMITFVLHVYKKGRYIGLPLNTVPKDHKFLLSLCSKLGLSCIGMILQYWQNILTVKDVRDLLFLFEAEIRGQSSPQKEVVELIMEVLRHSFNCTDEVCELLSFFTVGDENYKNALGMILENKSSYSTSILLTIAKDIWAEKKGGKSQNPNCMKMIEAAVAQIRYHDSASDEQLDWLAEVATSGSTRDIAKNETFQTMVRLLAQHGSANPAVLVRFLQNLEQAGPQWMKHTGPLTGSLIKAYCDYFSLQLNNCSHSSYNSMINKMLRARLECVKFVTDGGEKFDGEVVEQVRHLHRSKKKFIRMLDTEFLRRTK